MISQTLLLQVVKSSFAQQPATQETKKFLVHPNHKITETFVNVFFLSVLGMFRGTEMGYFSSDSYLLVSTG